MTTIDAIRRIIALSKIMTVPDYIAPLNRTSFRLGQYQERMLQIEEAISGPAAHCGCSDDSCPVWAAGYEAASRGRAR